jgi:hypothetical protein
MMNKGGVFFLLISVLSMGFSSCAYQLSRGGVGGLSSSGEGVESARVYVPVVDNMSAEAGPELPLTNALREALSSVRGLDIVNSPEEARFVLLGRIKNWGRSVAGSSSLGTLETEQAGGLLRNQYSAAEISVFMVTEFELVERLEEASTGSSQIQKTLWRRSLSEARVYEASRRFDEASGSSSAPHINRSREAMQLRRISESLARQIIDQVSQDF